MHLPHALKRERRTAPIVEVHTHTQPRGSLRRWIMQVGGAVGVGAVSTYLFDPDRGPARRAKLRDQAIHLQHEARDGADILSRDVRNRVVGVGAGLRYRFAGGDVDDAVLTERVRSQLGLVSGHAKAIDVSVSDGQIRLSGDVFTEEHDAVVRAVSRVPGVRSVDDQLRMHQHPSGVSNLQGSPRPRRNRVDVLQENWSPSTRLATGVAGVGLIGAGRRRGGLTGIMLRGGGLAMAARATTNKPLRQVTGIGAGRDAVEAEASVTVDARPEEIWPLISNYTNFPTFMANVLDVERLSVDVSRWTVRGLAKTDVTFDAQETVREEGHRIGWKTLPEQAIGHAGDVTVYPVDGRSRVQVRMHYNPVGGEIGHGVASLLRADARHRMRAELLRLRDLVEGRKHDREPAHTA